jgi:hypothetical protein
MQPFDETDRRRSKSLVNGTGARKYQLIILNVHGERLSSDVVHCRLRPVSYFRMSGFAKNRFCSLLQRPFSHSPGGTTQPWRTQDEYATLSFVVWWCVFVFAQLGVGQ